MRSMALNLNSCGHRLKSLARDGDRLFKTVGVSRPAAFWEVMGRTIRDRCDTNDSVVTTRSEIRTTEEGRRTPSRVSLRESFHSDAKTRWCVGWKRAGWSSTLYLWRGGEPGPETIAPKGGVGISKGLPMS